METRQIVKVFLGSPSDLGPERELAKVIVEECNKHLANANGYGLELVGWEKTFPGVGRPQELINRDLDECELFVGILWKRFGTPPGNEPYKSGFEEEYNRALSRNEKNNNKPEIHLFFKEIDSNLLEDPGDQLKLVINFKNKIFSGKKLLIKEFKDQNGFATNFRDCIYGYVNLLKKRIDQSAIKELTDDPNKLLSPTIKESIPFFSNGGIVFLKSFLTKIENINSQTLLLAGDVARLRLLSNIAGTNENDTQLLGVHDANLLFKSNSKFDFGEFEIKCLIRTGLKNYTDQNAPLWHWLHICRDVGIKDLYLFSLDKNTKVKIGALKAMCLLAEYNYSGFTFDHTKLLNEWFSDKSSNDLKLAAIEYLIKFGSLDDLDFLNEEFARNNSYTSNAAADAITRINFLSEPEKSLTVLCELQSSHVSKDLLIELFSIKNNLSYEGLLKALSHRNDLVRTKAVKLLKQRNELTETRAEELLTDNNIEVRFEAILQLEEYGRKYNIDNIKDILSSQNSASLQIGLVSLMSNGNRDRFLKMYKDKYYDKLPLPELQIIYNKGIFFQDAYFAFIRRSFKNHGDELRKHLKNEFKERFNYLLDIESTKTKLLVNVSYIQNVSRLENYLRSEFIL